jgi:uncharacterized membrane protein YphA (DoxX/SURF4 family)
MMRRLYNSFPTGTAGIGLLLLRLLDGIGLADHSSRILQALLAAPETRTGTLGELAATCALISALLLLIGLWTPVIASIAGTSSLLCAVLRISPSATWCPIGPSILFAALSLVVALLGPGALSLDAHLFGWHQIRFPGAAPKSEKR